jgi:hypothetical protein
MRTTKRGQSPLLLLDVIAVLEAEGIDYAVIGAMAASIHGAIRASIDADALISLASREADGLERKLQKAGFQTELRRGDVDDPIGALLQVTDGHQNRVDLLMGIRGMDQQAFVRAIEVSYHEEILRVVGREDFIAMKAFAGGPQDLVDARRAIASAATPLDLALLRRLAKDFGREAASALDVLLQTERK